MMQYNCQWEAVVCDGSRRNYPAGIVAVVFPSSRLSQCLLWPRLFLQLDGSREAPGAFTSICCQDSTRCSWAACLPCNLPTHPLWVAQVLPNMDLPCRSWKACFCCPGFFFFFFQPYHLNVSSTRKDTGVENSIYQIIFNTRLSRLSLAFL